jgi:hypothetical protein
MITVRGPGGEFHGRYCEPASMPTAWAPLVPTVWTPLVPTVWTPLVPTVWTPIASELVKFYPSA